MLYALGTGCQSCSQSIPNRKLPRPVLPDYPELVSLYWEAWDLLGKQQGHGNRRNALPRSYFRSSEEGVLHQWQTVSMTLFAKYAWHCLPVAQSLDMFYQRQDRDGYIARILLEQSGEEAHSKSLQRPVIHPPLLSWAEWEYYQCSGDTDRLLAVFLLLDKYFHWVDANYRGEGRAAHLYCSTPIGTGMDNLPREAFKEGAWVDVSAQMAAFARDLSRMAEVLGDLQLRSYYDRKFREISYSCNHTLWNPDSAFYYDMSKEGKYDLCCTIAGYWPLFAEIIPERRVKRFTAHLRDSTKFYRLHLFPSVAADEQSYHPSGFYWRGGVWSLMDYCIVQGLHHYGQDEFAREVAWNHVRSMADVYLGFQADSSLLPAAAENAIWEMYAPDLPTPGTRWDLRSYCQANHIVFSGHGPIVLLIEEVLAFEVDAPGDRLIWRPWLMGKHGIENLRFGDNQVTIWCEPRPEDPLPLTIHGSTKTALALDIIVDDEVFSFQFEAGDIDLTLLPGEID